MQWLSGARPAGPCEGRINCVDNSSRRYAGHGLPNLLRIASDSFKASLLPDRVARFACALSGFREGGRTTGFFQGGTPLDRLAGRILLCTELDVSKMGLKSVYGFAVVFLPGGL